MSTDMERREAFMEAVYQKDADACRRVLASWNPNQVYADSMIMATASCGFSPAIPMLVEAGADPDANACYPITAALCNGHLSTLRELARSGANVTLAIEMVMENGEIDCLNPRVQRTLRVAFDAGADFSGISDGHHRFLETVLSPQEMEKVRAESRVRKVMDR